MTLPFFDPRVATERRRADLARADDVSIKPTTVGGFELTIDGGTGYSEVAIEVAFPVLFTERPAMAFGGELDENEYANDGFFPTVSVVVLVWKKSHLDRVGGGLNAPGWFSGATLAVVTTGRAGQRMWIHWQATGKAIRDPGLAPLTGTPL